MEGREGQRKQKKYVCILDEAAGFKTVTRLADTKSTSPLWDYLQKKHPTEHAIIAHLKKGALKKTNEATGDAFYAFNSPKAISVNLRLLDLIQSRALPLNLGEYPTLRAFASELERRFNEAKQDAADKKKHSHLQELTKAGKKISLQVDMWLKDAFSFMSLNYTWTEFGEEDIAMEGEPPDLRRALVLKTDVLDFVEFGIQRTGENIAEAIDEALKKFGLSYNSVAILVLDGASNCKSAMIILREKSHSMEGHSLATLVRFCHHYGRIDAHGMGVQNPAMRDCIKVMVRVSNKFRRTPSLHKDLTESQLDAGLKPLQLTKGADSRWSGRLYACERYDGLRHGMVLIRYLIPNRTS